MIPLRGYALVEALRIEADDIANERRAALVRQAANEIERLIQEVRALMDAREASERSKTK